MPIYNPGTIDMSIFTEIINCIDKDKVDEHILLKHLCILLDAIKSIPRNYYMEQIPIIANNLPKEFVKQKEYLFHVERAFAYELYHRWSCLLWGNNDGLMLNGEIGKNLKWFYGKGYDDNGKQKYPDIVLHKGQIINDQMIVCEIKRMDNVSNGIVDDLNKLLRFTSKGKKTQSENTEEDDSFYPYHCGIYLITNVEINNKDEENNEENNWEKAIATIINQKNAAMTDYLKLKLDGQDKTTKKIICVYSSWNEKDEYKLSYQSLYKIISDHLIQDNNGTVTTEPVHID